MEHDSLLSPQNSTPALDLFSFSMRFALLEDKVEFSTMLALDFDLFNVPLVDFLFFLWSTIESIKIGIAGSMMRRS